MSSCDVVIVNYNAIDLLADSVWSADLPPIKRTPVHLRYSLFIHSRWQIANA